MAGVNNLLFSVQNMAPAMLGVGVGKVQNYNNLAELNGLLGTDSSSSLSSLLGDNSTSAVDKVSLTYNAIGDKIVSDMASVTAGVIKQYPELDKDYIIAIVETDSGREARVYRRSEILDNFEGTEKEKAALKEELEKNSLMLFTSANGLPETSSDKASQALATELNSFLKTNSKTLDILDKAGYDPLAKYLGSSTLKKLMAEYLNKSKETEKKEDSNTENKTEESKQNESTEAADSN